MDLLTSVLTGCYCGSLWISSVLFWLFVIVDLLRSVLTGCYCVDPCGSLQFCFDCLLLWILVDPLSFVLTVCYCGVWILVDLLSFVLTVCNCGSLWISSVVLWLSVLGLHSVSSFCCSGECQLSTSSCPRNQPGPGNDQTTTLWMPYHWPFSSWTCSGGLSNFTKNIK